MSSDNADGLSDRPLQSAQTRELLLSDELELSSGISSEDASLIADEVARVDSEINLQATQVPANKLAESSHVPTSPASSRPNKFNGSSSTWRSWTAADRAISNSLDQLKAEDLSVHLFNAHALKKRDWNAIINEENQDSQQDSTDNWQPATSWTAWPMRVEDVPRGQMRLCEVDPATEHMGRLLRKHAKPSQELEDLLTTIIVKEAKDRFLRRRSYDESSDSEDSVDSEEGRSRTKHSHSHLESTHRTLNLKPVVLADDDYAKSVLRPTVRHLLTRVDELLMGLHHARQTYLSIVDDTQSELQTDADDDTHSIEERKNSSRSSSKRGRSRKGRLNTSNPASSRGSSLARPQKRRRSLSTASQARRLSSRQARLGLRDWSDILAVASMQGWDTSVLKTTADRCASLFGEGIKFRTLREGKYASVETACMPTASVQSGAPQNIDPQEVPITAEGASQDLSMLRSAKSANGKLYCPIPTCLRSERGFEREWNFQEHVKNMHGSHPSSANSEGSEGETYGAVHVDAFLKPIRAQKGWRGKTVRKKKRVDTL